MKHIWRTFPVHVPPRNFIILHYASFEPVLLQALFFGASATPRSFSFSARTLVGSSTVNLSKLNPFQQVVFFGFILLGSAILVLLTVVHVRHKANRAEVPAEF